MMRKIMKTIDELLNATLYVSPETLIVLAIVAYLAYAFVVIACYAVNPF